MLIFCGFVKLTEVDYAENCSNIKNPPTSVSGVRCDMASGDEVVHFRVGGNYGGGVMVHT